MLPAMETEARSLRRHRELAGLSQAALADRSGVSQTRISELELGANIRPTTAKALADALGVPLTDIARPEPVEAAG